MGEVPDEGTRPERPTRLFTIGIPVFNGKSLLRACLQSVVDSAFPHDRFEILVADDGSTEPETLEILRELSETLSGEPGFFRVLSLGSNSGGAARPRNRILDEARGEYVFFVDADDTIGSLALERIAAALEEAPADWVALHQVPVNGRANTFRVRKPLVEVDRAKALTTLTVHKVFRRAEIERQRLRFDEGLPSGQDVSFAFSYVVNASRFIMLGGYDFYFLTQHGDNPDEPVHLSRRANNAERLMEKNDRILRSMLVDLRRSSLSEAERRTIVHDIVLPRVLIQQRYLKSIADAGYGPGTRALRRLSDLFTDPLVANVDVAELKKGVTEEHLRVIAQADFPALRQLMRGSAPAPRSRVSLTKLWVGRGRRFADRASGRARHRRVLEELALLRHFVKDVQVAQLRLEEDVRAVLAERRSGPDGR